MNRGVRDVAEGGVGGEIVSCASSKNNTDPDEPSTPRLSVLGMHLPVEKVRVPQGRPVGVYAITLSSTSTARLHYETVMNDWMRAWNIDPDEPATPRPRVLNARFRRAVRDHLEQTAARGRSILTHYMNLLQYSDDSPNMTAWVSPPLTHEEQRVPGRVTRQCVQAYMAATYCDDFFLITSGNASADAAAERVANRSAARAGDDVATQP